MALTVGIVATSLKENERRVPIHPDHFERVPADLRARLVFERGYAARFGVDDATVGRYGALAPRDAVLAGCDVVCLAKPMVGDLRQLRRGGVLWGWLHLVGDRELTQAAIDRRLTLITWESMNRWNPDGSWRSHVFEANNEIAGFAAVLDALRAIGSAGAYGPKRAAVVIGSGCVARGARRALAALGFEDVAALPRADIDDLAGADVIVNGYLQDPDDPVLFVRDGDVARLKPGCLIVDVSCDRAMGFPFARPTTFEQPTFRVGSIVYYGVDHTPSLLWNDASWEVSAALLPFLPVVAAGPDAWQADECIRRAVEVRDGAVLNPKVLSFQGRS